MDTVSHDRPVYHRKLFLWLVVYSVLLVGGFAVFQYSREKKFKAEVLDGRLQLFNDRVLHAVEREGTPPDAAVASAFKPYHGLRVSIIDLEGSVVYDNALDGTSMSNHLDRKEVVRAMKSGEGFAVRHSDETDIEYFYSARRGTRYIVRSAVPYTVSLAGVLEADHTFLWVVAAITLVMCVAGYFATRRLGQTVTRLNRFAERAERGERITGEEAFPHDELGEISNHIVRLYARLQRAIADRDREHEAALAAEQEKSRIKRRLTNNINHELKTPVAAMQACLETLISHKDLPEAKRDEFIERCYAANGRLRLLLADVSVITRMEDGGGAIATETVNLRALVEEICAEYAPAARERGMKIRDLLDGDCVLRGNGALLESLFRNLIDNALAYSGATTLDIEILREDAGSVTLSVSDNGSGVAAEHLPRLFERFYRVDRGRSRDSGGTGLGLAIVKNAVAWHGGTIAARNRSGGGLVLTFTLSKNK